MRLLSAGGGMHVARVWPCLAQLRAPPAAVGALGEAPAPDPTADARLAWQPAPARERLAAVDAVLREVRPSAVRVAGRELVALVGDEVGASVPLTSEADARALAAWCRFVTPILRGDEVDWEPP